MSSVSMDVSIDHLRALPVEKRLEIIDALWESVESELGPMIPDELRDEADREFEAHLADPSSSIPWEQVRVEMRRQLASAPDARLSEREQAEMDRRLAEPRNPEAAKPVDTFLGELDNTSRGAE